MPDRYGVFVLMYHKSSTGSYFITLLGDKIND